MSDGLRLAGASALLFAAPIALLLLGAELGLRLAGDMLAFMTLACAAHVGQSLGGAPFWAWGAVAIAVERLTGLFWRERLAPLVGAVGTSDDPAAALLGFAGHGAIATAAGALIGFAIYVFARDFTPRGVAATSIAVLLLWLGLEPSVAAPNGAPPGAAPFVLAAFLTFVAVVAARNFTNHPIVRAEGRGAIAPDRAAALGHDRDLARRRALIAAGALAGLAGPIAGLGDAGGAAPPLPEPYFSLSLAAMLWLAAGRGVHGSIGALALIAGPPALIFATIGGDGALAGWWIAFLALATAIWRAGAGRTPS